MNQRGIDVGLVAPVPDGTESLALGYLATALRRAGHKPLVLAIRSWRDVDAAARSVAALAPPLVGVSLPSGHAAIDGVAFAHRLRHVGWKGHLTCGGVWATLCRGRLLDSCAVFDSVVRHDGEIPLVGLADRIAAGLEVDGLPGVTTRSGDGRPAPVSGYPGAGGWSERASFKSYAGVPAAKISAVRGCAHACRYCGLAALRRARLAEMNDSAGGDAATNPGDGVRRRSSDDVADEMAWLYHEREVRFFHFVDENYLPRDPDQAVQAVRGLGDALARRGVGRRAVSLMLRADEASAPVVDALADLGLVRSLLGVESMRTETLEALGRDSVADANLTAMVHLRRRGIRFHFNVLLLHPGSTIESISRDVAALRNVDGGLLDPFQVEAFEGTDLFARLQREGRIRGGPFVWYYQLAEARTEAFAQIFQHVRRRAMGSLPLTAFAYEVLGTLAVADGLRMTGDDRNGLRAEADRLTHRHNSLWLELLERALSASAEGAETAMALAEAGRVEAARLALAFEALRRRVEASCRRPLASEIGMPRTAAAATLALAILGSHCYASYRVEAAPDADIAVHDDAATPDDGAEAGCRPDDAQHEHQSVEERAMAAGCNPVCRYDERYFYRFVLDADGHVVDIERDDGATIPEETKRCYLDAVAGQVFPCLAAHPWWEECTILLA
jgi:radical SAM superfamily enzyme YgiQ (UPF0313 family)